MSIVTQADAPAEMNSSEPIGRRPLLKAALAALLPCGLPATTRAGTIPIGMPADPLPSDDDDEADRAEPGGRCFRVVHECCDHYPAPKSIDRVIGDVLEDHASHQAWRAGHGMGPGDEDLAVYDRGRLAAAILFPDDGPRVERFAYPEPDDRDGLAWGDYLVWKCPDRVTYAVAVGATELYRCSRLGLTLDDVIGAEMDDYRLGMAWCAERGLEHPAEDRSIWEEDRLAAVIFHRPDGPEVIRFDFDGAATTEGGGR